MFSDRGPAVQISPFENLKHKYNFRVSWYENKVEEDVVDFI